MSKFFCCVGGEECRARGRERAGSYQRDVFDAKVSSRGGRTELRDAGNVEVFVRSGNVDNPDRNWSPWKKVDITKDGQSGIPAARYAQWKVVLHAGNPAPGVDSVTLNYLPKNVAPEIDDVPVQVGLRSQPMPKSAGSSLGADAAGSSGSHFESPVPSAHDRDSVGVKWSAHDENEDQLVYSVY